MDVQTLQDDVITTPDGSRSVQRLKVFCDSKIIVEDEGNQQKADRLWFQDKWFECMSSRLSENTPLKHWTATFVECFDLLCRVGCSGLLSVAEGSICYPNLLRHSEGNATVVEGDLRNLVVGVNVSVEVGLVNIL